MDLKEFVSETLRGIIAGVRDAQSGHGVMGARVTPQLLQKYTYDAEGKRATSLGTDRENLEGGGLVATEDRGYATVVQFDVALTVRSDLTSGTEAEKKAGGGVKIYVAAAEGSLNSKSTTENKAAQSTISRVKFSVPVQLP